MHANGLMGINKFSYNKLIYERSKVKFFRFRCRGGLLQLLNGTKHRLELVNVKLSPGLGITRYLTSRLVRKQANGRGQFVKKKPCYPLCVSVRPRPSFQVDAVDSE